MSSSKQPVSTTKIISTSCGTKRSTTTAVDDNHKDHHHTITLNASWKLAQLARVYKAAKKMQRVSSSWSNEVDVEVYDDTNSSNEKTRKIVIGKATMRIILIPYYNDNNSSAASVEIKLQVPVPLPSSQQQSQSSSSSSSSSSIIAIPPSSLPKLKFTRSFDDPEIQPEVFDSSSTTTTDDNNNNDVFFDEANGVCFETTTIPVSILSKTAVDDKKITDSTPYEFSVDVELDLSQKDIDKAFDTLKKRIREQEKEKNDNNDNNKNTTTNSETSKQEEKDMVSGAEENMKELVQGIYSTVGGFWSNFASKSSAEDEKDEKEQQEKQNNDTSKNQEEDDHDDDKSEKKQQDVDTEEGLDHNQAKTPEKATNGETTVSTPSRTPSSVITTQSATNKNDKKKNTTKTKPKRDPLPKFLTEALPTSERALHRWLSWITNNKNNEDEDKNDPEMKKIKTNAIAQFEFVAERLRSVTNPDLSSSSSSSSSCTTPQDAFTSSFCLLSSFAAASAMSRNDIRDDLLLLDSTVNSSGSDEKQTLAFKLAQECLEPTRSFQSEFTSISTSTVKNFREASPSFHSNASHQATTTPTTTTPGQHEDFDSVTNVAVLVSSDEKKTSNQNQKQEQQQAFFQELSEASLDFLSHFLSTIANVLVVQIEHGAHYRPLLRAEGWAKYFHYFYQVHHHHHHQIQNENRNTSTTSMDFILNDILKIDKNNDRNHDFEEDDKNNESGNFSFFSKHQRQVLLNEGYLAKVNKQRSSEEGNRNEVDDDDEFKMITDDFTITKEERMRSHFGLFTDIQKLLLLSSCSATREEDTNSIAMIKDRFSVRCLVQEHNLFMNNDETQQTISSLDQLLDFLSEIANSLSMSLNSSSNDSENNTSSNIMISSPSSSLITTLQNLDRSLESAEIEELELWGESLVSICSGRKFVTARNLRRKINVLLKAVENYG